MSRNEVSPPNSCEHHPSFDRQNCLPALTIIVAPVKERAVMSRNYLDVPESDGRAGIARCTEMTDLAEVAKSREGGPKGARTQREKNEAKQGANGASVIALIVARS